MIDAHLHVVPPNLPGVGVLNPLLRSPPDLVARTVQRHLHDAGIEQALAMGCLNQNDEDPLGVGSTLEIAAHVPGLFAVGVANPYRDDPEHFRRVEAVLRTGRVKAIKVYLGYLHFGPDHAAYRHYYELAEQYRLPVIFHTGDTYSPYAKLRYALPLPIDDVAVDHPEVRFVIAHVGNPWMLDAVAVVYKNVNVWTDLSGLATGSDDSFEGEHRQEMFAELRDRLRRAFAYAERPNRFLYGSDWPLAPMLPYRRLIESALPVEYHDQIFCDNARLLYRI